MTTQRLAGQLVGAVALLATAAFLSPREITADDGGWNTSRAVLVEGTTPTPTNIALAGGLALRDDISLLDGTIEADLDAPRANGFAGFVFRAANTADYDVIYFFGSNGQWHEVQYQPVFQGGTTWQLYPGAGYLGSVSLEQAPANQPMHVKIVFSGSRADVYVNGGKDAVLRVPELKRAPATGKVGLWVAPAKSNVTVSNYSANTRVDVRPAAIAIAKTPAGQIMRWRVSRRLDSPDTIVAPLELSAVHREALRSGRIADAESDGLMSLTRIVGNPSGPQIENVLGGAGWELALASTTLKTAQAHTVTLNVGYSDGLSVFLNGERVFAGTHPYSSPDLGRIVGEPNAVQLPLRAGDNELVLAVTDRAFGWGFRARLDDPAGTTIASP